MESKPEVEKEHVITHHSHEVVPVVEKEIEQTVIHPVIEKHEEHHEVEENVSDVNEPIHNEIRHDVPEDTVSALEQGTHVDTTTTYEEHDAGTVEQAAQVHENVIEHHIDVVQPVVERTIEKNVVHHVEQPITEHIVAEPIIESPVVKND